MGDKACSSAASRRRRSDIKAVIPVEEDQKANRRKRGTRGGCPPTFDWHCYKERNTVERCFGKLKQCRAWPPDMTSENSSTRSTIDVASARVLRRTRSRPSGQGPTAQARPLAAEGTRVPQAAWRNHHPRPAHDGTFAKAKTPLFPRTGWQPIRHARPRPRSRSRSRSRFWR